MRVLSKIQFAIAMFCSFSIIFYASLWLLTKITLVLFPSLKSILSTTLACIYIIFSIILVAKYGKRFATFINYKIFRSPF